MTRYAQLDATNRAIGYSDLAGEVDATNMILIGDDEDYTGYSYANGKWKAPPPPLAPVLTRISKFEAVKRFTPEEGDQLLAAMNEAPGRLRFLWDATQNIVHTDPDFQILYDFIASVVGNARATVILAPTE